MESLTFSPALHVPQLEGPVCGFEVLNSPKQLLSPIIGSPLIKTFQGCPHSTLLEKIQAPLVMLPIVCFLPLSSASTVLVFTHISLLCFVASSTLGLSLFQPRSSPLLTQRLPLGT